MARNGVTKVRVPIKLLGNDRALVDYLRGIITDPQGEVVEGQGAMACLYEHARESEVLRQLAAYHKTKSPGATAEEISSREAEIIQEELRGLPRLSDPLEFSWLWLRLIYWPLMASGDYDFMPPLFGMYRTILLRNHDRVKKFYGHDGSVFQEYAGFWGYLGKVLPEDEGSHVRHYYCPVLELTALELVTVTPASRKQDIVSVLGVEKPLP